MIIQSAAHDRTLEILDPMWLQLKGESEDIKDNLMFELAKRLVHSEYPVLNTPNLQWVELKKNMQAKVLAGPLCL